MLDSWSIAILPSFATGRGLDSNWGPVSGRAGDRKQATYLSRTAAHRLDAVVLGMRSRDVETSAVVTDFNHDPARVGLHANVRARGICVLDHIGESLASNAEEVALGTAGEQEAPVGSRYVYRQTLPLGELRGVLVKGRDEAVFGLVTVEPRDQRPHLGLRISGQLGDRAQGLSQRPGSAQMLCLERLLRRAGMEGRREHRLGDGVVKVARDAVPLLHRMLALVPAGLRQLRGGSLALAYDRREEQRRECRNSDVGLSAQGPVVDRLLEERAKVVRGHPDYH